MGYFKLYPEMEPVGVYSPSIDPVEWYIQNVTHSAQRYPSPLQCGAITPPFFLESDPFFIIQGWQFTQSITWVHRHGLYNGLYTLTSPYDFPTKSLTWPYSTLDRLEESFNQEPPEPWESHPGLPGHNWIGPDIAEAQQYGYYEFEFDWSYEIYHTDPPDGWYDGWILYHFADAFCSWVMAGWYIRQKISNSKTSGIIPILTGIGLLGMIAGICPTLSSVVSGLPTGTTTGLPSSGRRPKKIF